MNRDSISGSFGWRYAMAALAVLAALGFRSLLFPVLGAHSPYLPFTLAVIVAGRFGGRGPGVAATVLSALAVAWFFLEPRQSFMVADQFALAGLGLFLTVGSAIALLVGHLRESLLSTALAEAALRRKTELVDLSHDAIITADSERRITGWNTGAVELYGWTESEVLGKVVHELLQTTSDIKLSELDAILLRSERWDGELRHVARDGRSLAVESRHVLLRDEHNKPAGILEINRDLSERRRAEEALRESELQFRTLANAIPQLCWMANADGWTFWYNDRWYEYTGTTPKDTEGWGWKALHDPEMLPRVLASWKVSIESGQPFEMVFPLRGADGEFRSFLTRVMPVRDRDGNIARWFGTSTDITAQLKTEDALRESEERLRLAQQVAQVGTFDWNIQTGENRWSPELEAMYGLPAGGFGRTQEDWEQLMHPEDRPEAVRRIAEAMKNGGFEAEWRVTFPDGTLRWLAGRAWVFKDASGKPLRLVGVNIDITASKRVEEALRQASGQLRLALEAANMGAWEYHLDSDSVSWDARSAKILGVPATSHIPWREVIGFIHPDDRVAVNNALMQAIAGMNGGAYDQEFRAILPHGSVQWVAGHGRVFFEGEGDQRRAVRFAGVNLDVTERKKAEQALRDSERKYRALFEAIQEGFVLGEVVCDAEGAPIDWRFIELNPAMATMLGHDRDQIVGRTYREMYPEAYWEFWVAAFGRVALTGTPARLDHFGSGTKRHYDAITYSPARGQFAAILTDITDRKQAEQALARQKQQYEALAENAPEVIARFDRELRHTYINEYGVKVYGIPRTEILGKSNADLGFAAEQVAFWEKHFAETVATGKQQTGEFEFESPTFGHQHLSSIFVPEMDESGEVGSILAITRDVTGLREAEKRLRQAQKLECIGVLAGGVAHDFNNLLTVIMGSASSALEECPSCEHSKAILSASERAAYLTKQLLAYAGKGQSIVKVLDLNEVVSQAEGLLKASVPKRVSLRFSLSKDLPLLEADPSQIEQILMNLVINAGEAIPLRTDGEIEIITSTRNFTPEAARKHVLPWDLAPGRYVCLEVRDNGTGMDEATASRIFDPFFSTKFTGRGLGLAAVQGIVHAAKGFISVRSRPGNGTIFEVHLPGSQKQLQAETATGVARRQVKGNSTVLVVDDEEMVRKLACMSLRRAGYQVLEAQNGKEALEVLAKSPILPSVVLLDLAMPVMGGDELVPILERQYPGLKIVISSGYSEEDARYGGSRSAGSFLQKPYTVAALIEKIEESIGRGAAPPS